jgi:hypothetical protein
VLYILGSVDLKVVKDALNLAVLDAPVEELHLQVGPPDVLVEGVHYRVDTTRDLEFVSVSLLEIFHIVSDSCSRLEVAFLIIGAQKVIGKLVVEKWRGLILIERDVNQVSDAIFRVEHI